MTVWTYYYHPDCYYYDQDYVAYPEYGHSYYGPVRFAILSAVDNRELLEATIKLGEKHSGFDPEAIERGDYSDPEMNIFLPYPGFIYCPAAMDGISAVTNSFFDSFRWGVDYKNAANPSTMKIFTRPHTKEELQAAGMWPAANA